MTRSVDREGIVFPGLGDGIPQRLDVIDKQASPPF
jgi:hypothetical protein